MNFRNFARRVSKRYYSLASVLAWIGYIALATIILIVFADVCGRYFFHRPIKDAYGLVLLAMYLLGGFGLMYTSVQGGHIAIDLLAGRFPKRVQGTMQRITAFMGFVSWAVLGYCAVVAGWRHATLTTDTLHIPIRPFQMILGVAAFLCSLVLLVQTFRPIVSREQEKEKEGAGEL